MGYTVKEYIAQEFDEECLRKSIPQLPPYDIESMLMPHGDDLEGEWLHEWELPPEYL